VQEEKIQQPLVIFHSPCLDGFTAAWAAWLKYPEAEFVPGVYGQDPPDVTGRDVYLLDFSYKRAVLEKMALEARRLVVLDHHKSAMSDLDGFVESFTPDQLVDITVRFDMEKSGAQLAWEHFHKGALVPILVQYVEDRDLWKFKLYKSREVNAALFSYDYSFEVWNQLRAATNFITELDTVIAEGTAILRKQDKDIAELLPKLSGLMKFDSLIPPRVIPAVNLPYTLASDAGNLLAQHAEFAAVYYQDYKGEYVFSLRSREGGMDVSEVAKTYGGGGHKHAAGFRVKSLEDL